MPQTISDLLDEAGIAYRPVETSGVRGFLLAELPVGRTEGISPEPGLFLVADDRPEDLVAAALGGGEITESGTLRLGDREVPIHRCRRPGEPGGNLKRRSEWFQRRVR